MTVPDLGIFLPTLAAPGESPGDVVAAARHAEDLGFESVWVVDQLIAGTGAPFVESIVTLAAAAGATSRIKLGLGVLVVPLRPVAWIAKQVASLQHVSGGRVLLGIGAGGDRHDRSWAAVGVPSRERGARTNAALTVLRDLIAGREAVVPGLPGSPAVQLAPGAPVPPIVVGGVSPAAIERAVAAGDDWFLMPGRPSDVAASVAELERVAAGRRRPAVTASLLAAIAGDPALPGHEEMLRQLTDPDGAYGMPDEFARSMMVTGAPPDLAPLLAGYAEAGAHRVVVSPSAGDWYRQAELVAEAHSLAAAASDAQDAESPPAALAAARSDEVIRS